MHSQPIFSAISVRLRQILVSIAVVAAASAVEPDVVSAQGVSGFVFPKFEESMRVPTDSAFDSSLRGHGKRIQALEAANWHSFDQSETYWKEGAIVGVAAGLVATAFWVSELSGSSDFGDESVSVPGAIAGGALFSVAFGAVGALIGGAFPK